MRFASNNVVNDHRLHAGILQEHFQSQMNLEVGFPRCDDGVRKLHALVLGLATRDEFVRNKSRTN